MSIAKGAGTVLSSLPVSTRVTHLSRVDSENEQEVLPAAGGVPQVAGRGRAVRVVQSCPEPSGFGTGRTRGLKAAWGASGVGRGAAGPPVRALTLCCPQEPRFSVYGQPPCKLPAPLPCPGPLHGTALALSDLFS